eukprot:11185255-Lingulodinium_polyedra.AAC.1
MPGAQERLPRWQARGQRRHIYIPHAGSPARHEEQQVVCHGEEGATKPGPMAAQPLRNCLRTNDPG